MGVEGDLPTTEQIAHIRSKIDNYIVDNGDGMTLTNLLLSLKPFVAFLLLHSLSQGRVIGLPLKACAA